MLRVIRPAFLAALAVSHVDDTKACTETSAFDELEDVSSLLQRLHGGHLAADVVSRNQPTPSFAAFVQQHNRVYTEGTSEYGLRRSIFERRAMEAQLLNERPTRLWTAGLNHLSDWTNEELSHLYGWKGTASRGSSVQGGTIHIGAGGSSFMQTGSFVRPLEVSWAHLNASQVAHNQGSCGSCWAFASALMLEANHEIHRKSSRTFSVQELLNCVENKHKCGGEGGCRGATVELAMDYVTKHGLDDNIATPYAEHDMPCSGEKDSSLIEVDGDTNEDDLKQTTAIGLHRASETSKGFLAFGMAGWERLPENKYEPLMQAVAEHGPLAVSVAASAWSSYIQGIFDGCDADAVINHAVTLLGYGRDDGMKEKFWLVQNSWGPSWGEKGSIRLLRRDDEETQCGTDSQPKEGTGCDGGPAQVTVCGMCGILYDAVMPHFSKVD